jgi:Ca2+-binding EF-hand superfamily protein
MFWSRVKGTAYEKLTLIFEMYDRNKNNYIDFNELHSIVKILLKLKFSLDSNDNANMEQFRDIIFHDEIISNSKLPLSYNIAMYIMNKLDLSRNARLNKDEFVEGCLNNENICKFLMPLKV